MESVIAGEEKSICSSQARIMKGTLEHRALKSHNLKEATCCPLVARTLHNRNPGPYDRSRCSAFSRSLVDASKMKARQKSWLYHDLGVRCALDSWSTTYEIFTSRRTCGVRKTISMGDYTALLLLRASILDEDRRNM